MEKIIGELEWRELACSCLSGVYAELIYTGVDLNGYSINVKLPRLWRCVAVLGDSNFEMLSAFTSRVLAFVVSYDYVLYK